MSIIIGTLALTLAQSILLLSAVAVTGSLVLPPLAKLAKEKAPKIPFPIQREKSTA